MASTFALVLAAGRGARFGGMLPKQYLSLGGSSVLRHAVNAFARHPRIDGVLVTIRPEDREMYDRALAGLDLLPPVPGGAERQDSVRLGLEALAPHRPERVLIHDGARPFPGYRADRPGSRRARSRAGDDPRPAARRHDQAGERRDHHRNGRPRRIMAGANATGVPFRGDFRGASQGGRAGADRRCRGRRGGRDHAVDRSRQRGEPEGDDGR